MIKAINIQKSYGSLAVLKGVDLSIEEGEIVSVVGKSGAGKSTLVHIVGTLDKADSGKLYSADTESSGWGAAKLAEFRNQNIGFVFQFHHLLPEFTALENVCIPAFIKQTSEQVARKKAADILAYLGLQERFDHKPGQLSGGEQQRVAVARALINSPAVIFADEPTGNLDSSSSQDLHQLLFKLREDFRQTFVIVTHNDELAKMSDRVLVMKDGKLADQ